MIGLLIFTISFFIFSTSGFLGKDLIFALEYLQLWYIIIAGIFMIISLIVFLFFTGTGMTFVSTYINDKLSIYLGGLAGSFLGLKVIFGLLLKITIQLVLVWWLLDTINPQVSYVSDLTSKQIIAIGILFVLSLISKFSFSFGKK